MCCFVSIESPYTMTNMIASHLHLSASMSFPGVSRQRRIMTVCWRTTAKASSSNRAWSSTGGGGDAMVEQWRYTIVSSMRLHPSDSPMFCLLQCTALNMANIGWPRGVKLAVG